jgi:hypothetical protein
MLRKIAILFAFGLGLALLPASAGALPFDHGLRLVAGDQVTLVREGCGRGMQWNERRRRCVQDSTRAKVRDAIREIRRENRCPPGRRWSNRRDRCVRD